MFGRSHSIFDGLNGQPPIFWGAQFVSLKFPITETETGSLCTSPMRFGLVKKDTSFSSSENMTGSGQIRIFHQPILVGGFILSEKY